MTVAVWLFTAGNMRGWVYRRAIFAASVASLARTKGVLPCMLVQTRLAANGMRNISVFVLFVGTNGEVRLRFATPDVFAGADRQRGWVSGPPLFADGLGWGSFSLP